ncbi:ABC-three component system middle component 2 [Desulfovibrio litoralis]|uniref:Threonine transporter n=1 Tax=Desulfovibrio litoralis DSM 11393 TaxID=1121455 RepID=A0A1M7TNV2_9BACT|nr:ABC-three component system middle component 2 [Desulfovibrio litoralis]SHN72385.1 hypothetical protein SAMN02745728_02309 [Desulfovibrio litoralis DSM 11393]
MNIPQIIPPSFNSPLEAAIRAIVILTEIYPCRLDLQEMVKLDHLIVHTKDINGPQSLHPQLPLRNAEILVRRKIVEQGLFLLISKKLVSRVIDDNGIYYEASDYAAPFIASLESTYTAKLTERAIWINNNLLQLDKSSFRSLIEKNFGKWTQEFQPLENSYGVKQ